MHLGVDRDAALIERERHGRNVGRIRICVGWLKQARAQCIEHRLFRKLGRRGSRGAGAERKHEHRGGLAAHAQERSGPAARVQQHGHEREQKRNPENGQHALEPEGDENGAHLLRGLHRTIPAIRNRAPRPLRHAGPRLDAGLGVEGHVFRLSPLPLPENIPRARVGFRRRHDAARLIGLCGIHALGRDLHDLRRRRRPHRKTGIDACHPAGSDNLQLRIKRLLNLLRQKRNQNQDKGGEADPFSRADEAPAPTLRHHPQEGERHKKHQPDVPRRIRLVVRESKREKREHRGAESPKPEDGERKDEQEKKIEERPRGQPIALHPIRPEEREEPPAGRQVERDPQGVGIRPPARRGKFPRARHAARGLKHEVAAANLHAGGLILRVERDELALPRVADRAEILARRGIEPPDLLHLTADVIAEREPAPVFIEPQDAREGESRRLLLTHPAHAFLDAKRRRRVPTINRQRAPFFRKGRLGNVDRGRTGDLDHAEIRSRAKRDQRLGARRLCARGVANFLRVVGAKRVGANRPFPRAHLCLHPAGIVDRDGDRTLDRRELPAFGQDRAEILLAALARNDDFDFRAQPHRNAVLERGVHLHRKEILVGLLGGAVALQPKESLRVPRGRIDRLAVDAQGEDADFARQRNALRDVIPSIHALEFVRPGRQADRGRATVLHHGNRSAAGLHLERPRVGAARQRHPRVMENGDAKIKARARALGLQCES